MAARHAEPTWAALVEEAHLARRVGFTPAAYFASGRARDPLGEAERWADRLRPDGIDAVVDPCDLPRLPGVGRKDRRNGAALLIGSHDRQHAFEVLLRAGGGFPLIVPRAYPDVLTGEAPLVDLRSKSGNGLVATATRAITIRDDVVRVVPISDVMGVRTDDSGLSLVVRDEGGRTDSWAAPGLDGDRWATFLSVAAPDLVRSIFGQVAAGVDTSAVAERLDGLLAFGRSWDRDSVRRLLTSRAVEQGFSPAGIIDSGTWQQAQLALEREKRRRGTWREHVRPRLQLIVPALFVSGIAFLIYVGVKDALTPRGSTASKPFWLGQQGTIGGGWSVDADWTSFWPSAPAPQLVVDLSLTNDGTRPETPAGVITRLRLRDTTLHPVRRCYGKTGLLSPASAIAPNGSTSGVVCFDVVVLHPASLRLVVEPRPGTRDHVVWYGLVKAPVDNSGDGGG